MKRAPLFLLLIAAGAAWALLIGIAVLALEGEQGVETGELGFQVDAAGRYHLSPCEGNEVYAFARRTEHQARTAHFLWWPLYDHYWGDWQWTRWAGSGTGRAGLPSPSTAEFADAAARLAVITRLPGLDYARVAVPGGAFSQRVYYWPGIVALLVSSFMVFGPATVWILRGAPVANSKRRAARRASQGLCGSCGYSRHGLGAKEKCPECGGIS